MWISVVLQLCLDPHGGQNHAGPRLISELKVVPPSLVNLTPPPRRPPPPPRHPRPRPRPRPPGGRGRLRVSRPGHPRGRVCRAVPCGRPRMRRNTRHHQWTSLPQGAPHLHAHPRPRHLDPPPGTGRHGPAAPLDPAAAAAAPPSPVPREGR